MSASGVQHIRSSAAVAPPAARLGPWLVERRALVSSTNDAARGLVTAGCSEPFVILARAQQAARGRLGRAWAAPPGGVWATFAWPMRGMAGRYTVAPLLAGLAAARAAERAVVRAFLERGVPGSPPGAAVKWPNDVLIGGRKVAGVLGEALPPRTCGSAMGFLLLGVGINAGFDPGAIEAELGGATRSPATTLDAEAGAPVDAAAAFDDLAGELGALLAELESPPEPPVRAADNPEGISAGIDRSALAEVNERLAFRGERVRLLDGGRETVGVCERVDPHGRLILRMSHGAERAVLAGEVDRVRAADGPAILHPG